MSIFVRTFSLFYYRHPPTKREPFVAEPNLAKSNNPRVWVDAGKIPFDMDRSHARLFVSFRRHSTRLFIPFRVFVFFSSKFFLSAAHQQPLTINQPSHRALANLFGLAFPYFSFAVYGLEESTSANGVHLKVHNEMGRVAREKMVRRYFIHYGARVLGWVKGRMEMKQNGNKMKQIVLRSCPEQSGKKDSH